MTTIQQYTPIISYNSHFFSLKIQCSRKKTHITMRLFTEVVNTAQIPTTYTTLNTLLPSIFTSMCFNEQSLPFSTEVLQTEIGHLFEHVILEYLCKFKLDSGTSQAIYSGLTRWNWHKEPRGVFHISLTVGSEEMKILAHALDNSIHLLNYILSQSDIRTVIPTSVTIPTLPQDFNFDTLIPNKVI